MSVAAALTFIRRARTEPDIRAALAQAAGAASLQPICAIGAERGLAFAEADFDRALKIEWAARWAHYGNPARTGGVDTGEKMRE